GEGAVAADEDVQEEGSDESASI
ncbi:hypothetical protein A2U01_0087731, partial [Trifolium medium]|nr:hypothetical protein [Trifolium medium]